MSGRKITGGCQCGAVRYFLTGNPLMTAICHCSSCRRANAAPMVAWALFEKGQVDFEGNDPKKFSASEDVERSFCAECGTPLTFEAEFLPGLIDITVGSFDDPEAVRPTMHYWHSKHLSWIECSDSLPRHPGFPPVD